MKSTLLILFSLIVLSVYAQETQVDESTLKEYFYDAEFFLEREYYIDAVYDFMEVYNNGYADNANLNYKIGICYLNIPGQKENAIKYFQKASESASPKYRKSSFKEEAAPLDVYLYLGNAYRVTNQLDKAIEAYTRYKEIVPEKNYIEQEYASQQIQACQTASRLMANPNGMVFENLGEPINNNSANFRAVLSDDGHTIVYMNSLPFYDAIYYSTFVDGAWTEPRNITPEVQSDGDQYVCDISPDGTELLLAREDDFDSDIYYSKLNDTAWSKSEPILPLNTSFWESHACFANDSVTVLFTSNRPDGLGDMDIYRIQRKADGGWGNPENLGTPINSPLNEDTPFLTSDGSKLFFSSQSNEGMGGYDLFMSMLQEDGSWSEPKNMGYPVSTTDDDLFLYPMENGDVGIMAFFGGDGYGDWDIYGVGLPDVLNDFLDRTYPLPPEPEPEPEVPVAVVTPVPVADDADEVEDEKDPIPVVPVVVPKAKDFESKPIYFAFNSAAVSGEAKEELNKYIDLLTENENGSLIFYGYADSKGPAEYNKQLGKRRAEMALQYLVKNGIDATRLSSVGKGEVEFIAINETANGLDSPEGRAYNRRVEVEIQNIPEDIIVIIKVNPVPESLRAE